MKYVCELCGTVYDEDAGDVKRGIPAGTSFSKLPRHYDCPGCGCEKEAFTKLEPKAAQEASARSARPVTHDSQYLKYASDRKESER